jgi:hydroxymethylbilane synthase
VIVFGSRRSELALVQTRHVAERLRGASGVDYRIETIATTGDARLDVPLAAIGTKGAFTVELEDALREGRIDVAVHSLKDLPVEPPPGVALAAIPERADSADVLLIRRDAVDDAAPGGVPLRRGARLGTSSPRRRLALLAVRPDLDCRDVRGNVGTRIDKLRRGDFAAVVFAAAGLDRLAADTRDLVRWPVPLAVLPPAPGQGALGVQCRAGDERLLALLSRIDDAGAAAAVAAERALLEALGGGCSLPLGAIADVTASGCRVRAALFGGAPAMALRAEATAPDFAAAVRQLAAPWQPLLGAPVAGLRVAVVRADGDGGDLPAALAIAGATVACVALTRAVDVAREPAALQRLLAQPVLAFASARAVARLHALAAAARRPCRARDVLAIGPTTASAAAAALGAAVHAADGSGGRALAALAAARLPRGATIGFPCAAGRNPAFEQGAAAAGLTVHAVPVYRVEPVAEPALPAGDVDVILFTAPSAVAAWRGGAWRPAGARLAAIGPTTGAALRDAGLRVDAEAANGSAAAVVAALRELCHARSS